MRHEHVRNDAVIQTETTWTHMQTAYILTETYIPGNTLDSLTNTHIFIPADIEYRHIQRPYTHVRTGPFLHTHLKLIRAADSFYTCC